MSTHERLLGGYTNLVATSSKIIRTGSGPSGEIGRHIGLKIRRFVNNGRTGSIPVSGTTTLKKQIFQFTCLFFEHQDAPKSNTTAHILRCKAARF